MTPNPIEGEGEFGGVWLAMLEYPSLHYKPFYLCTTRCVVYAMPLLCARGVWDTLCFLTLVCCAAGWV